MDRSKNAFIEAVLHQREGGEHETNWTRGVCRALAYHNFDEVTYYTAQLMEPSILIEVARDAGLSLEQVETFDYEIDGPASVVKWLLGMVDFATHVQRLNLAYCLSATARYGAARAVLRRVDPDRLQSEQRHAYFMIKFVIDNRGGTAAMHDAEFVSIKEMIERGEIAPSRVLDTAAQVIVWHLKTRSVSGSLSAWFIDQGLRVASSLGQGKDFREQISLSCFHRAYAMVPAARKDAPATREEMRKAEHFAHLAQPRSKLAECTVTDARKTVLESTLKEMLYVAGDLSEAERVAEKLIELDPNWSISYHEAAEVKLKLDRHEEALALYRKARELGLPRVAFSQYMIGACLMALGQSDAAVDAFDETLSLDPSNISAGISGYRLSRSMSAATHQRFNAHLERWDREGILRPEHKELLS